MIATLAVAAAIIGHNGVINAGGNGDGSTGVAGPNARAANPNEPHVGHGTIHFLYIGTGAVSVISSKPPEFNVRLRLSPSTAGDDVVGVIENTGRHSFENIQVRCKLYGADGLIREFALGFVGDMGPHEAASVRALGFETGVARFDCKVTGDRK